MLSSKIAHTRVTFPVALCDGLRIFPIIVGRVELAKYVNYFN